MADIDAALVQQIFYVPKGQREPDIHHYRQADDLRAGFEIAKWGAFCHPVRLRNHPARLKPVLSDSAREETFGTHSDGAIVPLLASESFLTCDEQVPSQWYALHKVSFSSILRIPLACGRSQHTNHSGR